MIKVNNILITPTIFPDKTSQVWKLPEELINEEYSYQTVWDFENEAELFHLMQLKMLLNKKPMDLFVYYLPYARQDKPIDNNNTFALETFAKFINSLNFRTIECYDPHSKRAEELIHNLDVRCPRTDLFNIKKELQPDLICYPDKGAVEKYTKLFSDKYIYGEKVRDQLSGNIIHYEVIGECKDKKILIQDDICDGGMTFKILSESLIKKGAKEINLFVTHGLFTKGIETLKESGIKRIFSIKGEHT